jgi:hypothetical protein
MSKREAKPGAIQPARTPTHERQGEIMESMDALMNELLLAATPDQRELSLALNRAAFHVALCGTESFSRETARRLFMWVKAQKRPRLDDVERYETADAVARSTARKSRVSKDGSETAFEEVARERGISPSTAEKRRYRKPKR